MTVDVQALRTLIESERVRFDVPGAAVVVVAGGEVVLAEGFGVRDLESGAPVTAQTLFPIASDTKCFTAATLCVLADEGLLDLDEPVQTYVPWFAMHDAHATALVSARDLLSHRTGLPRHDLVWFGADSLDLVDVVKALPHLPLSAQIRQTWQYNNLAYSTAGYLTEQLAGMAWKDVVGARILTPLGMTSTGFSAHGEGDFAMPYNEVDGVMARQVLPSNTKLGPPGGMVSNAEDLAKWVLARLGKAPEALSDAALKELHTPAMIGGTVSSEFPERQPSGYALGCQVESYRGHRLVRHGGNLVGYSSDVTVAPQLDAAVVVLTNMHGTALRDAIALMVIDQLTGDEPIAWGERYFERMTAALDAGKAAREHAAEQTSGRPGSLAPQEIAGVYTNPAYGSFTLVEDVDGLRADFHDLGDRITFRHKDRDVWSLTLTEFQISVPVVFSTGPEATVTGLTIPFEPLVAPIPFTKQAPPVTPGLIEQIAGSYSFGPISLTVTVLDAAVTLTAPSGKVSLEPLGGNAFGSPQLSTLRAEFETDAEGVVIQLVLQPTGVFTKD